MRIRIATSGDLEAISRIVRDELHIKMPGFRWDKREVIREMIEDGEYFVGVENGVVVAVMGFSYFKRYLRIETLAVSHAHHRKGLGAQLIRYAKRKARTLKVKFVYLESFYEYKTKGFYRKMGFVRTDYASYGGHRCHCFEFYLRPRTHAVA